MYVRSLIAAQIAALVGGAVAPDATWSVALCAGADAASCALRCSGALIAPNVVLTARHCALRDVTTKDAAPLDCAQPIDPAIALAARDVWVTSATSTRNATWGRGGTWTVARSTAACGHDVALLTLERPFVMAADAFAVPRFDVMADRQATDVTLVAYGGAGPGAADEGSRHSRGELPISCMGDRHTCRAFGASLAATEFLVDVAVCPGDSGGGAVLSGTRDLVGVTSRALAPFTNDGQCGTAIFTSLGEHALMLARTARAAADRDGIAAPPWVASAETRGNASDRPPRAMGAPCDGDDDCASGSCRSQTGAKWICCDRDRDACFEQTNAARAGPHGCTAAPRAGGFSSELVLGVLAIVLRRVGRRQRPPHHQP